jgi:hypothetical protein
VRKANLQAVDQLGKAAEKAKAAADIADSASHDDAGGKKGHDSKGAGHAGGHSGNGH